MTERSSYAPGTPSWVDLATPDPETAKRFYGELFGWEAQEAGPVEETGGYAMFTLRGSQVAGVGPTQGEGQPPAWSTYVSTDDADAVAARVQEAGGNVMFGPMDVMDAGRMAVFAHPAAGVLGAWQPGRHTGAQLVNEPGSFTWNELQTRDVDGAKQFCADVFGWTADDQDFGGTTYTTLKLEGNAIAGMMAMPQGVPDEVPAFWLTYFSVADCDATLGKLQELGGTIRVPPIDSSAGRFAVVADPQGAQFAVIASASTG